ncbi:hypothetical protein ACWOEJ_03915 [Enterococcus eurekensis]|uniref:Uncharacterized protein n=1 Tax=Enterococcus eurekensis TaxID=1159753 RepID=A0ABV9M0L1_9ENTE
MTASEKYIYSLRLGIDPHYWDQTKMDELKQLTHEAKLDDINLIINSEELNVGHVTKKQVEPWLAITRRFMEDLKDEPVTISMNPWTNLLYSDRGRHLTEDFKFRTMVDYQGVKATAVACPADPKFVEYIAEIYGMYASVQPSHIWLDDDFRHFNHKPLTFGCFCEGHMAIFNQKLGDNLSREAFVARVFQEGAPTKERRVFLEQVALEMNQIAKAIAQAVHEISPETRVGLMSSQPEYHALEGRDWHALFEKLSIEHPATSRPHLPSYNEIPGLKYIREFNRNVRPVADMLRADARMLPELENYMYSMYAKSNKFTQLQLETTLLVGAKGILFNFYDMMGNGVVQSYNHQKILAESKQLLDYSAQKPIKRHELKGVKVLYSPRTVYTRHGGEQESLEEMFPREFEWSALLSTFGINSTLWDIEQKEQLNSEVVAISDQLLRNLSDEAIIALFEHNQVLLDGTSVAILFERQLAYLIKAKNYEWLVPQTGQHTHEEWNGSEAIEGVFKARMTVMQQIGHLASVEYESEVECLTSLYNENREAFGTGMAQVAGQFFVLPIRYHLKYAWDGKYINYKEKIIKRFLAQSKVAYLIDMPVVQFQQDEQRLYFTNFSLDDFEEIRLCLPEEQHLEQVPVTLISRDGQHQVTLKKQVDHFVLPYKLKAYETIILERQ